MMKPITPMSHPDYDPETPFEKLPPEIQKKILDETFDLDRLRRYIDGDIEETLRVLEGIPRAIDLRKIPRDQWEKYITYDVVIPAELQKYIDGQEEVTTEVCDHVENSLTAHYLVFPPYCIYFDGHERTAQLLELPPNTPTNRGR